MRKRRWLIPLVAIGGLALYRGIRRAHIHELSTNLSTFSGPSAGFYDAFAGLLFGGFYDKVAHEVAARCPAGRVLDVGSGPGILAVRLAGIAPQLIVIGVDISPDMVERARSRAAVSNVGDRVSFVVGDVGQLPYGDGDFDMVVSTFSMHHWPDPARGLAEIYRVLKPGGVACIYDISDGVLRALHHDRELERAVAASPFRERAIEVFRWPWRVPAIRRMCLRQGVRAAA